MEISVRLDWVLDSDRTINLEPALMPLLRSIHRDGSLKAAAKRLRLSYRHAWGLLHKWEKDFGAALVSLERGRGRGARLTPLGAKLLWADDHLHERIDGTLQEIRDDVNAAMAEYLVPGHRTRIRMFASHGMAITCLHDLLQEDEDFEVELQIHGSLDSLHSLSAGECRIAGFHVPLIPIVRAQIAPQYRQWLTASQHQLVMVAVREQGIIVKRGNPKGISSLRDLTNRSVRFMNRQINSGTRTTFDELLVQEEIDSKQINGYTSEEFTHVAVAAMVASGATDAGFGIKAAAQRFELDFVPVLKEAYVLALDTRLDDALRERIQTTLQSGEFRNRVNNLAGYDAAQSGMEISFDELLGAA